MARFGGPPVLLKRFFRLLPRPLPNVQAGPVGGDALERHVALAPDVIQGTCERLLRACEGVVLCEQLLHQDLEPQHRLRAATSELSCLRYRKHFLRRWETRVQEYGIDVRGAQQRACQFSPLLLGAGCEDGFLFRLATEEAGQRPDEAPVEGRARYVVSRHPRVRGLGEGPPPARKILEGLIPTYAVAVVIHDRDLGEVYRLHSPPFNAWQGKSQRQRRRQPEHGRPHPPLRRSAGTVGGAVRSGYPGHPRAPRTA